MHIFELDTWLLAALILAVVLAAGVLAFAVARRLRSRSDHLREPYGVLQAALFGVVALILAFGLSLAVGRHDSRRTAVVNEANAIGTTYLRAQTIPEPMRSTSLDLLVDYTDTTIALANSVPGSAAAERAITEGQALQDDLWAQAGLALDASPDGSAVRLYVETLNDMIDQETVRISALNNRVPGAVLLLEVIAAACAVALLTFVLALHGRGFGPALVAASLMAVLLFVTFDLDRPTRGTIRVPDAPLTDQSESMDQPPAAAAPADPGG